MKYINFTPEGLGPGNTYRVEVFKASTPDVIYWSKHNLISGQEIVVPVDSPGSYIVKLYNTLDTNGVCVPDEFSEEVVNILYPIVSHVVGEVDCDNEVYTVSFTITNPTSSPHDVEYGWSYSNNCSSVSNWTKIPQLTVPSNGSDIHFFYRYNIGTYAECCDFISTTNKPPCINCRITINNITVSCGSDDIVETCKFYRITSANTLVEMVYYTDCELEEIKALVVNPSGITPFTYVCSSTIPTSESELITITEVGDCPNN